MLETPAGRTPVSLAEIAAEYGLALTTVRTYNGQAAQRRRLGKVRPHDFPEPCDRVGNSPVFDPEKVRDWFEHRPGQGKGGGRPRKRPAEAEPPPAGTP